MLFLYNKNRIIKIGIETTEIQRVNVKIGKNTTFSCFIFNYSINN